MTLPAALLCLTALGAAPTRSPSASSPRGVSVERVVVLPDVTVLDGTGGAAQPHRWLVIRGRRIAAVLTSGTALPRDAEVLERFRGHTVMPGLIDAHVHLATSPRDTTVMRGLGRAALLGGITTVRDMGGNTQRLRQALRLWGQDTLPTPRVLASAVVAGHASNWFRGERATFMQSPLVAGDAHDGTRNIAAADSAALVRDIQALRGSGFTAVKLLESLTPAQVRVATRTAQRAGLSVWSHFAITPVDPMTIVRTAPQTVSHAEMAAWALVDAAIADTAARRAARSRVFETARFDDPRLLALLDTMRVRRVALDPTLTVFAQAVHAETQRPNPDAPSPYQYLMRFASGVVRAAAARGVTVIAGTDALGGSSPNLHLELQLLVDSAGFTPVQAIRAATGDAARVLGVADSLGTIAVGKLADLAIVNGDPARDIRETLHIRAVMRAGQLWERERPLAAPALARAPTARR